jgi:hypothetical protein
VRQAIGNEQHAFGNRDQICSLLIAHRLLICPRMKKRNVRLPLFLLALVFIVFLIRRWNEPERKEAFDRMPARVIFTPHARCQMDCRQISQEEVKEIMQKGIINFNKSNRMARPCPVFTLQGRTSGGASIRVFFSQCPGETTVISCYILGEITDCHCPGVEKKEKP